MIYLRNNKSYIRSQKPSMNKYKSKISHCSVIIKRVKLLSKADILVLFFENQELKIIIYFLFRFVVCYLMGGSITGIRKKCPKKQYFSPITKSCSSIKPDVCD